MKYTDCIPGKIYKTWFRDLDYYVIKFTEADKKGYFRGEGVYIGKERRKDTGDESNGLCGFKYQWQFGEPSESDLQAFYNEYPELNKNIIYEIY